MIGNKKKNNKNSHSQENFDEFQLQEVSQTKFDIK